MAHTAGPRKSLAGKGWILVERVAWRCHNLGMSNNENNTTTTKQEATDKAAEFAAEFALQVFDLFPGEYPSSEVLAMAARAGAAYALGASHKEVYAEAFGVQ